MHCFLLEPLGLLAVNPTKGIHVEQRMFHFAKGNEWIVVELGVLGPSILTHHFSGYISPFSVYTFLKFGEPEELCVYHC